MVDIFIDPCIIFDILGPGCKLECGERLSIGIRRGCNHAHERRLAVATQRVKQNPSNETVSLRNVTPSVFVGQRGNHIPQCAQTLVNLLGLLEPCADGPRDGHAFGPGQVHQVQLAHFLFVALLALGLHPLVLLLLLLLVGDLFIGVVEEVHLALFDGDYKNGVGSRGNIVHLGACGYAVVRAGIHELVDFRGVAHCPFRQVVDLDSLLLVLPDFQFDGGRAQQVGDGLILNLQE